MYGNIKVLDTLISSNQTVAQFGEQNAFDVINEVLQAHNELVQEMIGDFASITTERLFTYGTSDAMEMRRVDEFGAVDTQKVAGGQNLGLPLYLHQIAVGWTRKAMQQMTTERLAAQFVAANDADVLNLNRELRRALFNPINNLGYIDRLIDQVNLEIRALLNGDGQQPGVGLNGETFAGTHTHFTATASLTAAAMTGLVENVREHGVDGQLTLFIARADETAFRALPGFQPYVDARIVQPTTATFAQGDLELIDIDNRAIGIFGPAEVWVKPWVPATYQVAIDLGASDRPLGLRVRDGNFAVGPGALSIAAEHDHFPLRAQFMEREFGLGVVNRDKAAVHFSGGATYTAPAIS